MKFWQAVWEDLVFAARWVGIFLAALMGWLGAMFVLSALALYFGRGY